MSNGTLILASASPRRLDLLREIVPRFDVMPCNLDEPTQKPAALSCAAWVMSLAYFKARAVADEHPGRWILGADTVVECGGQLLGKPRDQRHAREMLALQIGLPSDVLTGFCLLRSDGAITRWLGCDVTRVWMRADSDALEAWLAGGEWAGKAGAYGIQDVRDRLVERIEGSFSNVVGLPVERVAHLLQRLAIL